MSASPAREQSGGNPVARTSPAAVGATAPAASTTTVPHCDHASGGTTTAKKWSAPTHSGHAPATGVLPGVIWARNGRLASAVAPEMPVGRLAGVTNVPAYVYCCASASGMPGGRSRYCRSG